MKLIRASVFTALLTIFASSSFADTTCSGVVVNVGADWMGRVSVQLITVPGSAAGAPTARHYICNVISQNGGLTPPSYWRMDPLACRAGLSALLAAREASASVSASITYVSDAAIAAPTSCASITDASNQPSVGLILIP